MISSLDSLVFKNPFEIIRTRLNWSSHQSNQNHNGKISKVVPAMFKINRTQYSGPRADENFPLFSSLSDRKNQTITDKVLLANDRGN